jgi:hypothetical protein
MIEFNSEQYDCLVAHNLYFDENVVINAMKWDMKTLFDGFHKQKICTMQTSRLMCKLPTASNKGFKFPKLKELYFHIFGRYPLESSLHSSLFDVLVLTQCIQHSNKLRLCMGLPVINSIYNNGVQPVTKPTQNAIKE